MADVTRPAAEEWPDPQAEGTCDSCGKERPIRWEVDPYISEIWPEDAPEPAWWCYPCFMQRKDDV